MSKITVTKDSRKKADIIIDSNSGNIKATKDLVVRIDGDDANPCKATRIILMKIKAGQDGDQEEG